MKMRMPQRRPTKAPAQPGMPAMAPQGAGMGASSPTGNPDMMEQQMGIVGKRPVMAPPRLGSLKHLRQMMQGHAKRY